jgi:hypothetical protein
MFIRNIMRAIARLLGFKTQRSEVPVLQTQTVGPVLLGRTARHGNQLSVQDMSHQLQPAPTEQKTKRSRARKTTAEASPKQERTSAKRTAIQPGQQQETPAFPTPRRVGRPRKVKA